MVMGGTWGQKLIRQGDGLDEKRQRKKNTRSKGFRKVKKREGAELSKGGSKQPGHHSEVKELRGGGTTSRGYTGLSPGHRTGEDRNQVFRE